MRRTGMTTRKVDEAIQMLFKHGFIQIPIAPSRFQNKQPENYILDDAVYNASFAPVQNHLKSKILDRLRNEHYHIELEINNTIISIKKDEFK